MCLHHAKGCHAHGHADNHNTVKAGLVHVIAPPGYKAWPHVDFDYPTRQAEIENDLVSGCPDIDFEVMTVVGDPAVEIPRVKALAGRCDALLVFVLVTSSPLVSGLSGQRD